MSDNLSKSILLNFTLICIVMSLLVKQKIKIIFSYVHIADTYICMCKNVL